MEDETVEAAVKRVWAEMREVRGEMKTLRDGIRDVLEQNEEYKQLEEELKELSTKRVAAKKLLDDDRDYRKLADELEEFKFKYKDLQEIMSHNLVAYYNETQKTEITDDEGETRQVILTAKIGKPEAKID